MSVVKPLEGTGVLGGISKNRNEAPVVTIKL